MCLCIVSAVSRLSNLTNLSCFHPMQPNSLPSPVPLSTSPSASPTAAESLPRDTSRDALYADPEGCYRMPVDAITHTGGQESPDPHSYADPDAIAAALRAAAAEATTPTYHDGDTGLAYGSVSVAEAEKIASPKRKAKACTVLFDDGPYKTTSLTRATSLTNVPLHTSQEAGLYLVRSVAGGSWNKRVSTDSETVPTPGHQRSTSMSVVNRNANAATSVLFRSMRGPPRASSLSNLLDSRKQSPDSVSGSHPGRVGVKAKSRPTFKLPPRPPAQPSNVPPKPPRIRHVDPDYIFVGRTAEQEANRCESSVAQDGLPVNKPLRASLSVPTLRLHKRASGISQTSNGPVAKHVAVVVNTVPRPLVRLASSERIEQKTIMQQPAEAFIAEPLADIEQAAGCLELKSVLQQTSAGHGHDAEPPPQKDSLHLLEAEAENQASFEYDHLSDFDPNALGSHSISLPDLSSFSSADWTANRVKKQWNYRMSAVQEGSRDENDSRQASLEASLKHQRLVMARMRSSAIDEGDASKRNSEPSYWILESQNSRDSVHSVS